MSGLSEPIVISGPPTQEEFTKYGERFLHAKGRCPRCKYNILRADDLVEYGEAKSNRVWDLHFIEIMTDSREVATEKNATGESNSTIIFCKSKCMNCGLAHESSFMGPRMLNDIARKQVEFLHRDYNKE